VIARGSGAATPSRASAPRRRAQLQDADRDHWTRELAAEQAQRGVRFDDEFDEPAAFALGLHAVGLSPTELVPLSGRPVAVQRELSYALAPDLDWTIQCFLDLETLRESPERNGDPVPAIVDYKVKSTLHSQAKADHDPQAGLDLAGCWLASQPAEHFCFAQIGEPGQRRKTMSSAFVVTRRTHAQMRVTLARIAQATSQIVALYERYGLDEPWGSPTPAAGSARRATAHTTRGVPGAAGCSRTGVVGGRQEGLVVGDVDVDVRGGTVRSAPRTQSRSDVRA